jgi:hypothetical protein
MSYDPVLGLAHGGPNGEVILGDPWGFKEVEQVRRNFIALTARRAVYPLGGSRNQALQHNAVIEAYDYLDIEIDSTELEGLRVIARVEVRVENVGLSVTPQIYNVTDASVAGTGAACAATAADYSGTDQKQSFSVTLGDGVKKYRLRLTPSNNTYQFWAIGYLECHYSDDVVTTVLPAALELTGSSVTSTVQP